MAVHSLLYAVKHLVLREIDGCRASSIPVAGLLRLSAVKHIRVPMLDGERPVSTLEGMNSAAWSQRVHLTVALYS